jgi:hypothetical protein
MLHADTRYWGSLYTAFDDFQVLLSDPGGTVVAFGHTIPFVWDGTPEDLPDEIDRLMERATEAYRAGTLPQRFRRWPPSCRLSTRGGG